MITSAKLSRILLATLLPLAACSNEDASDIIGPERGAPVLVAGVVADTLPADGASTTDIRISVDNISPKSSRSALVFVTAGALITASGSATTATIPLDQDGMGLVRMRSGVEPAEAVVYIQYAGATVVDSVLFVPALPERLVVTTQKFSLPTGPQNSVEVTAVLRRTTGRVSSGRVVDFTATDSAGVGPGAFSGDPVSDTAGAATMRFTAGVTEFRGPLFLSATTDGVASENVSDTTLLWVVDPTS